MRKIPTPPGIGEEYKVGRMTTVKLCEKYNISQPTLLRMLDELGVERRRPRPPNSDREPIPGVGKEYKDGATIQYLKNKYHIHNTTLARMIESQGVPLRKPQRRSTIKAEHAKKIKAEYRNSKVTVRALADKYNYTYGVVYGLLSRDPKITMRPGGRTKSTNVIRGIEWEYATGASIAKLARKHRRSKGKIREMLIELGVTIRPKGSHV